MSSLPSFNLPSVHKNTFLCRPVDAPVCLDALTRAGIPAKQDDFKTQTANGDVIGVEVENTSDMTRANLLVRELARNS